MASIKSLNKFFSIQDKAVFSNGKNNQTKLDLTTQHSKAEIYLHGAHLTQLTLNNNKVVWLSPDAIFDGTKAIRGGIPICWPWFGKASADNNLPQHGFARNSLIEVDSIIEQKNGDIVAALKLKNSETSMSIWPFKFELVVTFQLGEQFTISLSTHNLDSKPINISEAIHTYFAVEDIEHTRLVGLSDCHYFDQLSKKKSCQQGDVVFNQETDNIYDQPKNHFVIQTTNRKAVNIKHIGANAAVVWNPWNDKAASMADFTSNEYTKMLCVEAANIQPIEIAPGLKHTISQTIYV